MELHYKKYGEGQPFIILHGLLGASGNWHTLSSKVFGEHFAVYAVDQRNHGRSPHSDEFSYPAMAADLEAFMQGHGLPKAHLMGHSMGGKTAMHFALTHPDAVDRLIVVDMAPRAYEARHDDLLDALGSLDLSAYGSRQEIDAALATRIPAAPVRQFLLKNLLYDSASGTYSWQVNLEGISRNYEALNEAVEADGTFEGPALFIRGGRSDYLRDDDAERIRRLFPQAEIATIPEAGHWVHAEAPQPFARRVLDFLTR